MWISSERRKMVYLASIPSIAVDQEKFLIPLTKSNLGTYWLCIKSALYNTLDLAKMQLSNLWFSVLWISPTVLTYYDSGHHVKS